MPKFNIEKILPYKAKEIYNLVMDIEHYPHFLPWCKQAKIAEIISNENLTADLLINFKGFFEKYRSDVKHHKISDESYFVESTAISGPFKHLFSSWKIEEFDDKSCKINFLIDFEFNSFILKGLLQPLFISATEKMVAAFEERAKKIYN